MFWETSSWLNDQQLLKYLEAQSFESAKDALDFVKNYILGEIYHTLGIVSLKEVILRVRKSLRVRKRVLRRP